MESWISKALGYAKYAGAAVLALGVAVLLRKQPVAKPKEKLEKGPDMKVADDNAEQLDKKEEVTKEQHAKIEEVLQPKPITNKPLRDAVDDWNRDA